MNEPKKVNLLKDMPKKETTEAKLEKDKERVDQILTKYGEREQEYIRVGESRAAEDKKRIKTWKNDSELSTTTLKLSATDKSRYEDIRRKMMGSKLRLGYRHLILYALSELEKKQDRDIITALIDVATEAKRS